MTSLTSLWKWSTENRPTSLSFCAGVVALGVLVIAIGETQDWGWTRLIGSGTISVGSVLFGVLAGWSEPVRPVVTAILRNWRRALVILLTAIMVVPLLAGFLAAFGGVFAGDNPGSGLALAVGALMIVLMLGVTAGTVGLALTLALRGQTQPASIDAAKENGREDA